MIYLIESQQPFPQPHPYQRVPFHDLPSCFDKLANQHFHSFHLMQ